MEEQLIEMIWYKNRVKRNKYINININNFINIVSTIRSFGDIIVNGKITKSEVDKQPSNLLKAILQFVEKIRAKSKEDKNKDQILMKV